MTKEEAYEKLELPVGSDLHIVRQKFQQMHNSFQVQIDGAFREDMRQKLQTRLMELEEAYAVLNESRAADDSASLPRTEKTFEQINEQQTSQKQSAPKELKHTKPTLQQALALFGLTEQQEVTQIEQQIASHIANLQQQLSTSPLQTVKDAYQIEIDKATSAKKVINKWLDKRKKEDSQKEEPSQQEQATPTYTSTPEKPKSKTGLFIGIAAMVMVVLAGFYFLSNQSGNPDNPIETATDARQDSIMWQSASTGNSEATYQLYLKEYPEGIFSQSAKDSITALKAVATQLTTTLVPEQTKKKENPVNHTTAAVNSSALIQEGKRLLDREQFKQAETKLREALNAGDTDAVPYLAWALDGLRRHNEIIQMIDKYPKYHQHDVFQLHIAGAYDWTNRDKESAPWYEKSANQGNADAQYNLGYKYFIGSGVKKNKTEALKWYRKAAEQGHRGAQNTLGDLYYRGYGVNKDDTEAIKWYKKAAKQGDYIAINELKRWDITDYD